MNLDEPTTKKALNLRIEKRRKLEEIVKKSDGKLIYLLPSEGGTIVCYSVKNPNFNTPDEFYTPKVYFVMDIIVRKIYCIKKNKGIIENQTVVEYMEVNSNITRFLLLK